jgi:hypothetical protein
MDSRVDRRRFLAAAALVPALSVLDVRAIPKYRVVTRFKPWPKPGMPGAYPGRVITVHSPNCIDEATEKGRRAHRARDDLARDDDAHRRP